MRDFLDWNPGIGETFAQNAIGPSYVFRARKIFTCQIGVGVPLSKGPAMDEDYEQPPLMLLYSICILIGHFFCLQVKTSWQ